MGKREGLSTWDKYIGVFLPVLHVKRIEKKIGNDFYKRNMKYPKPSLLIARKFLLFVTQYKNLSVVELLETPGTYRSWYITFSNKVLHCLW